MNRITRLRPKRLCFDLQSKQFAYGYQGSNKIVCFGNNTPNDGNGYINVNKRRTVSYVSEEDQQASYSGKQSSRPTVCILGGGFGGLYSAVKLNQLLWPKGTKPEVILIDQNDRFVFKPLLYELLTGQANEQEVAPKFKALLDPLNVKFIQDTVVSISPPSNPSDTQSTGGKVQLAGGQSVPYDYLVIGLGVKPNYNMIKGSKQHALPFSTYEDCIKVRQQLDYINTSASSTNASEITVIGAGYAGVELALAVASYVGSKGKVQMVTPTDDILPEGQAAQRVVARKALQEAGVEVICDTFITAVSIPNDTTTSPPALPTYTLTTSSTKDQPTLSTSSNLLLWGAGNTPSLAPPSTSKPKQSSNTLPFQTNQKGFINIKPTLQSVSHNTVFAVGDGAQAAAAPAADAAGAAAAAQLPPTAQVALQQADYVAWNIWALQNGKQLLKFKFNYLGTMVAFGNVGGMLTVPVQLPGPLAGALEDSRVLQLFRNVIDVKGEEEGTTVSGSVPGVVRRLAYVYRQPTGEQRMAAGVSAVSNMVQDFVKKGPMGWFKG